MIRFHDFDWTFTVDGGFSQITFAGIDVYVADELVVEINDYGHRWTIWGIHQVLPNGKHFDLDRQNPLHAAIWTEVEKWIAGPGKTSFANAREDAIQLLAA